MESLSSPVRSSLPDNTLIPIRGFFLPSYKNKMFANHRQILETLGGGVSCREGNGGGDFMVLYVLKSLKLFSASTVTGQKSVKLQALYKY